jgi:leader peptidase (prepilin peptidase) / N-methyltransferase
VSHLAPFVATALVIAAIMLAPAIRRLARTEGAWLREPWPAALAALAGIGAAFAARSWFELVAFAALGLGCAWLILVDLSVKRLPDLLVGPSFAALLIGLFLAAADDGTWERLGRALIAAVALFIAFLVLAVVRPADLGLGDVKLAAPLGLFLGWFGWGILVAGALLSFAVAGVVAAILLIARRAGARSDMPFGPAMVLGTALAVPLGPFLFPALT